jgi:hypothetical protein
MPLKVVSKNKSIVCTLLEYAEKRHISVSVVDGKNSEFYLPGKPLTDEELTSLITKSRNSGEISLICAHQIIRNSYNAD